MTDSIAAEITTWIGPLHGLRAIRSPAPVPSVPIERTMSETLTLAGVRKVQRAPRAMRRWSWTIPFARAYEISALMEMEQGLLGSALYLYDDMVARWNMLSPGTASPGLGGDQPWVPDVGGTLTYGVTTALTGLTHTLTVGGSGDAIAPAVPVIVGRSYTAAVEVSTSTRLRLQWINSTNGNVSITDGSSGIGRRTLTAVAPAGAVAVRVRIDPNATIPVCSKVQLIEGAAAVPWLPGEGMPRIALAGMEQGYQVGWERDLTFDLVEVA